MGGFLLCYYTTKKVRMGFGHRFENLKLQVGKIGHATQRFGNSVPLHCVPPLPSYLSVIVLSPIYVIYGVPMQYMHKYTVYHSMYMHAYISHLLMHVLHGTPCATVM